MKIISKRNIKYPMGLERAYAKEIVSHTKSLFTVVRSFVPYMVNLVSSSVIAFDDTEDELSRLMSEIAKAVESLPSMQPQVEKMYDAVRRHATKEITSVFMSVFGAVPRVIPAPLRQDDEFEEMMRNTEQFEKLKRLWVQQNLDLIKSIDAETLRKIRETMADMIIGTVDRAELNRTLIDALKHMEGVEERRAALIGRDQVGKLNGRLSEYQQRKLGIEEYIWVTAGDERVRPSHRALNGKKFRWDDPPPEGHPGYPIQCRCIADPVIDIDKINLAPKAGTFAPLDEAELEQAKKRDRKIPITDIAIKKVQYVEVPGLPEIINEALKDANKELLQKAKDENKSDEMLGILSFSKGTRKEFVPGTIGSVGINISDFDAYHLFVSAQVNEIYYLHNHPSGSSFSLTDIMTFIGHPQIGLLSVVTNQGKVFMLHKTSKYDYNKTQEIFDEVLAKANSRKYTQQQAVREFLKRCSAGGVQYVR